MLPSSQHLDSVGWLTPSYHPMSHRHGDKDFGGFDEVEPTEEEEREAEAERTRVEAERRETEASVEAARVAAREEAAPVHGSDGSKARRRVVPGPEVAEGARRPKVSR